MDTIILQLADLAESIFSTLWLPLFIWTVLSLGVWAALRSADNLHPVYQYHLRMALIFSLPAGLLALTGVDMVSEWLSTASAETSLKVITLSSPIAVTFIPEESSGISLMSFIQASALVLFLVGVIFFIYRIIRHSLNLLKLRNSCSFTSVKDLDELSSENVGLTISTRKNVQISFIESDIVPVTFGFRKPVILLPGSLKRHPEKMNLAIRHELTHISQHDFFSHLMVVLTEAVFWFHPLVHRLKRELVDYREMRCDNMVLSESSVSKKEYAALLLELIPMPNINKELSVHMAQESSNLKKRIQMITQSKYNHKHSKRISLSIFSVMLMLTVFAMACTDMQTENVFDEEDQVSNVMTDIDQTGERGFHEIIIFRGENGEMETHQGKINNLDNLPPDIIKSIDVFKGEKAVELYGEQGKHGVIVIKTHTDPTAYNTAVKALGMEAEIPPPPPRPNEPLNEEEDYFVVVEEMPELIGGLESIMKEVRYPATARNAGIEGRVFVQFVVNEQGGVEDARVVRGVGGGLDEEALRVVRQAKFKPGIQRGKPVRVKYSLPIFFRLAKDEAAEQGQTGTAQVEQPATIEKKLAVEVQNDNGILRGRVLDGETQRPLAGANVILAGTNTGSTTDLDGTFSIKTDGSDEVELIFSYIGYERASMNITR
jgi:TonB family protein